jgi:hypothetical protein
MPSFQLDNPPSINATELHRTLLESHANGNRSLKGFIDALRALCETKLYRQLGFPGIVAYADKVFHYRRTQTFEFIRVSRALASLPQISGAFARGELSFALVSKLTRVASAQSEGEWLALASQENAQALEHLIDEARYQGRDKPRRGKFGLPGMPIKISFELAPAEHAVVEAALKKVAVEMGETTEGPPEPKAALLHLCRQILATDDKASVALGRKESTAASSVLVVHCCPDCAAAAVETEAGRVEIDSQSVEALALKAEVVHLDEALPAAKPAVTAVVPIAERDQHNTDEIRRQIRLRDGGRCANPHCRRELGEHEGHCHHIHDWSHGGRTELGNEVLVCEFCHALLHAGLLTTAGNPACGLAWDETSTELTACWRQLLSAASSEPIG